MSDFEQWVSRMIVSDFEQYVSRIIVSDFKQWVSRIIAVGFFLRLLKAAYDEGLLERKLAVCACVGPEQKEGASTLYSSDADITAITHNGRSGQSLWLKHGQTMVGKGQD
jgi:hypothetical protein